MRLKELSVELRDRIVLRHGFGKGYQKMSAALKVPKNTVASIILTSKKFGNTKTLPRAGHLAKLSNRGRRALVRDVTNNLLVTHTEPQSSSVENLREGQPSLQHTIHQAFMVEWPDGSHSSVKGT
uniref:Sleeping Beauty transposase HTH domain-containing protein n=1 Tax=Oncorhynchus tshawytscha TaxID=74940 RepID=A0AAZ3P6X5_ONCTS